MVWPADRVVDLVFQPLITTPVAGLPGGTFRRTIALAHLLLLTTTALILIADSPHASRVPEPQASRRRPDACGDVDRFLGNLVATAPRAGHA